MNNEQVETLESIKKIVERNYPWLYLVAFLLFLLWQVGKHIK